MNVSSDPHTQRWGQIALPLAVFFAVTAEMAPAGAVAHIAEAFDQDLARAALGSAVYALATAVVAIPLAALLQATQLRKAFLVAAVLLSASSAVTALAPGFNAYLGARTVAGIIHGGFFPLALALAARASPDTPGRAVARVLLGNACALAVGVPVGEMLAGTSWRLPFALCAIGLLLTLPWTPHLRAPAHRDEKAGDRASLRPVAMIGLVFGFALTGHFAFYTFLAPWVEGLGLAASLALGIYGISVIIGTAVSGRLAGQARLIRAATVVGLEAVVLTIAAWQPGMGTAIAAACMTGLCFGLLPTFTQTEMLARAGDNSTIASGIAVVAFNAGIAGGAGLGGRLVVQSPEAPFILGACLLMVSAVCFMRLGRSPLRGRTFSRGADRHPRRASAR